MRKILTSALILIFMLNMLTPLSICAADAATSSISGDVAQRFVLATDIMPMYTEMDFVRRTVVTRGEFAAFLCSIDKNLPPSVDTKFRDVDEKYEFAKEVAAVCEAGYMEAYDGLFYPNGTVLASDVMKALVLMSGYEYLVEYYGGGEQGYRMAAMQSGISKAIEFFDDEVITVNVLSQMIYNCLDIKVFIIDNISTTGNVEHKVSDEHTFMNTVMKLFKTKGVITDNGYTALKGNSAVDKYSVIVDNTKYYLSNNVDELRECIGRTVEIYYTIDDNAKYPTIKFYKDDIDQKVEFEIGEFISLNGRTLTFYDADTDREYKYTLKAAPSIIYNGKAESALLEEYFNGDNGKIVLSKSKGASAYDTIFIENYVSWYITNYDLQNNVIYTYPEFKTIEGKHFLKLDTENDNVFIYDTYGMITTDAQLYNYTVVDVLKNDDFVKIKIAPKGVFSVKIDKIKDDKDVIKYYIGEKEYVTTKAFAAATGLFKPSIGDNCNLYFNSFGDIVYAELEAADVIKVGYAVTSGDVGTAFQSDYRIKLVPSNGVVGIVECADKVSVLDKNQNRTMYKEEKLKEEFSLNGELIQYRLNAEGEINYICLAAEIGTSRDEGVLGMIYNGHGYHSMNSGTINAQVSVGEKETLIFMIDETQKSDGLKYKVMTPSQIGDMRMSYSAYNTLDNSMYAEYILIKENVGESISKKSLIFVENFGEKMVDDDIVFYISGYNAKGVLSEYTVDEKDFYTNIKGLLDDGSTTFSIEIGDWLLASVDANGRVNDYLQMFYRPTISHPLHPDGRKGYVVNNIGYYDSTNVNLSNPFYEKGGNANILATTYDNVFSSSVNTSNIRWIVGYVLSVDKFGGIIYTTQDLTKESYNPADTRYVTEARMIPTFTTVNYGNGKISVAQGMPSDILAYNTVGTMCSKILVKCTTGQLREAYIVNGDIN